MDSSASVRIDSPASAVYAYVMDVTHDPEWRSGVVEAAFTSDPPLGIGSTGFDRIEAKGRQVVATWTVIDFEPGVLARWTLDSGPIRGTGGYICEPVDSGTRFTLEAHVEPTGWYRMLGPTFGLIGRKQNRSDVLRLKALLEDDT
jgi:Polyketide cyclase / dehydrase and lipid transport